MTEKNSSQAIPQRIKDWMLQLGYVHDSEVEEATSTAPRTRARWRPLRPVYFGKEAWYRLDEIKRHLDGRAASNESDDDDLVCL